MIIVATGAAEGADFDKADSLVRLPNSRDTLYARQALKRKSFPVVVIMLSTTDLGRRSVEDWALDCASELEQCGFTLELRV